MPEQKKIYPYEECEQYVNLLQENVTRMAGNSANCKNWLIVIIGGMLALCFSNDTSLNNVRIIVIISIILTILFYFLDSYYLGLERRFKNAEKLFIKQCKDNNITNVLVLFMSFKQTLEIKERTPDSCNDLLSRAKEQLVATFKAAFSLSTIIFYWCILISLIVLYFKIA
ncbi:MAG: hypothetical protein IKG86_00190 [Paludibacteraceae bacterium]|nr:hypothetical protein [Paludibacteraceae bacterium]